MLPEYPRPQLARQRWLNLNGLWSFNVVPREHESVAQFVNYTASSGIWQTVWLEPVAERRIEQVYATADTRAGNATLTVAIHGACEGLMVEASLGEEQTTAAAPAGHSILVTPRTARLWTPDDPHLYPITVRLLDGEQLIDEVSSYFALREVGTVRRDGSTWSAARPDSPEGAVD